jgi:hypothetical protein
MMTWFTDLLKEYPSVAAADQRINLRDDEYGRVVADRDRLDPENEKLWSENALLQTKHPTDTGSLIEMYGVQWRVQPGRPVTAVAYCPKCATALGHYSAGKVHQLECRACHFVAPFSLADLPDYADELTRWRAEADL